MAFLRTVMTSGMMLGFTVGMSGMTKSKSGPATSTTIEDALRGTLPAGATRKVFVSGHSLTDLPFPDYLAEIAAAAGSVLLWDMQNLTGSSIRQRLYGEGPAFVSASHTEENPSGVTTNRRLSIASGGNDYDVMIITEQHRLLDSLMWQDTIHSLKAYHDRFIAANPTGRTHFFAPWISLSDRTNPSQWINYEKEALPIWQCIVAQVNQDIAAQGRTDRIQFIPTSWALASLIDHLASNADVPGFQGLDTPAKIDAIFSDDVHLSRLGAYYVAAISFSAIYPDSLRPIRSQSLAPDQADALHAFATTFMDDYRATSLSSEKDCTSPISLAFASLYASYTERTYHRREKGFLVARLNRIRDTFRYAWRFSNGFR
jgi:hypothetical protein